MSENLLIERIKSVLCDPEGRVCIHGSDGDRTVIQESLVDIEKELADYETLKRAVNESTNECGPDCDDHGHGDGCPALNPSSWLEDQQRRIETLEARLAEAERTEARLRRGLQFYADGCHCEFGDPTDWDSVSGEPSNFLCDEHGSMIEDGSVARRILEGADIGPDDDGEEVFIDAPRPADSAPAQETESHG